MAVVVIKDFDDILPHIGSFGRFQQRLFIFSLLVNYFMAVVYFGQIYMTLTPEHWCAVPELVLLEPEVRRSLSIPLENRDGHLAHSRCRMFDIDFNQTDLKPNSSWPTKSCSSGWEYDLNHGMYSTIVSELNWVCADKWRANSAQSLFFAGAIVGNLFFSYLADSYGRLPILILTNLLACVTGIATGFSFGYTDFLIYRFLAGMPNDIHQMMMSMIFIEYVNPEKRTLVGYLPMAISFTAGAVTLPWIAYGLGNWRWFCFATSAPLSLILLAIWIVPESSRWLVQKGRINEAAEILKKCAASNGQVIDPSILNEFKIAAQKSVIEEKAAALTWLDLFRTPKMRNRMLISIITCMAVAIVYDGHIRSLEILAYNVFITNSLAGFLEFPADLIAVFAMDRLGRRWTMHISFVVAALAGIASWFIPIDQPMGIAVLALIIRLSCSTANSTVSQTVLEIIPTPLRGRGYGFVNTTGHLATFFSPMIIYLSTFYSTLPYLILGIISLIGGITCLYLPETTMEYLPDSIAEAELFGHDQTFFYMPCLHNRLAKTSIQGHDNPAVQVLDEASATDTRVQTTISLRCNDLIDSSYL